LERTLAQSGVTGRAFVSGDLTFAIAGREDDADLRRLLRDNATEGWIRLALAREPDAFAAAAAMGQHQGYIIARHRETREPVGMCEWSARESFVDGNTCLLGYLGSLRIAPRYRHRLRVLKGGFEAVRLLLHHQQATPYALTAIGAENHDALRLLGANLPGMPTYRRLEEFSTFALRPRRTPPQTQVEHAGPNDLAAIAVCLTRSYRQYQFAPVWSARDLADPKRCPGLRPEDFLIVRHGPGISACVALWDQSTFKQIVVSGYSGPINWARPLINLAAPALGTPRLPAVGEHLRQVYLSHLAVDCNDTDLFRALIDAALAEVHRRRLALALAGLATRHPLAAVLRRQYQPREYRTVLHLVQWTAQDTNKDMPAPALPHVEIAVL
jgi:hypothetical protein